MTARSGVGGSGPIIAKTNAMPGKAPGTCVYSMKVPANQDLAVGVESFSWGSTQNKSARSTNDKMIVDVKGESSFYKFVYKQHLGASQANLPLYVKLAPRQ
ncbi:MAG TPA: hypothetical protein VFO29_02990 [Candidatus Rubrimentiphilum sp.]|nr:hypothetical protein [Candidatus Rubrimentiphilum sp.]